MLKSDKSNDNAARLSLSLKCGQCIHFKRGPAYFQGGKCSQLGVLPDAKACTAFTPDVYQLSKVEEQVVADLGKVAKDFGPAQMKILAFTFANMSLLKKHGLRFGQPVFVNLSSPRQEYVECYFKGYVIGASKEGDSVYLTSSLNKKQKEGNVTLSIMPSSILTKKKFDRLAKKLIQEGKRKLPKEDSRSLGWKDRPQTPKKESEIPDYLKYEIPTIESVPDSWWDRQAPADDYDWHAGLKKFGRDKKKGRIGKTTKVGGTTTYEISGRKKQSISKPKKKSKMKSEKSARVKKKSGKSKNKKPDKAKTNKANSGILVQFNN